MALWYNANVTTRKPRPSDKFRHRRRLGTEHAHSGRHRGWSYQLVRHRTGTTVERTVYNAAISNPKGEQVGYLHGYSSADSASQAARDWIDYALL